MRRSTINYAQKLLRRRKFSQAIQILESRREIYRGNFQFYLTCGIAYLYVEDFGTARAYFQEASRINETDVNLLLGLAAIFLRQGDTDKAMGYYLDILEFDPTNEITKKAMEFVRKSGDYDTIWGGVWNDDEHRGYQFWEDKFNRLTIGIQGVTQLEFMCQQVEKAWKLALSYFPGLSPKEANKRILWDADDNDQHLTEYIVTHVHVDYKDEDGKDKKLGLNIRNAHKTDRVIMYDRIRTVLRTGDLLLIKDGKCSKEADCTICKRGPDGQIYNEIDDKVYHPDLLPAMRYAMWNVIGMPEVE